jgi:SAM-dependent methyltransferase
MHIPFFSKRPQKSIPKIRKELVLRDLDLSRPGLEIGPGPFPLAPKREGYRVHTLDVKSEAELREGARLTGADPDLVEPIDFVWQGEPYAELVGQKGGYDWVIASHVVEHTPDLIAFLNNCADLLSPEGILSLVVPDKRYCFDYFRPLASLGQVVNAYYDKRVRPGPGTVLEHHLYHALLDEKGTWAAGQKGDYRLVQGSNTPTKENLEAMYGDAYHDSHVWTFTPSSFRLIIQELHLMGFTTLREASFTPSSYFEFFVTLSREGAGSGMSRLELLRATQEELQAAGVS